jgi:hypothetical protein
LCERAGDVWSVLKGFCGNKWRRKKQQQQKKKKKKGTTAVLINVFKFKIRGDMDVAFMCVMRERVGTQI